MSTRPVVERVEELEAEVGFLLRQVKQLKDEKDKLVEEVDLLRKELLGKDESEGSLEGFSVVEGNRGESSNSRREGGAKARGVAARGVIQTAVGTQTELAEGSQAERGVPTRAERESIAVGIGDFFKRCLAGEGVPRGLSGRDRVPLQNRYYVVIRDYEGRIYRAARVFHSWKPAKAILCQGESNSYGESIFCGFATLWEAEIAVRHAGYVWPGTEYWGYDGR